jgi:hypothetical protein
LLKPVFCSDFGVGREMLLDELGIRVELEREGGNNDDPLDGGNDMLSV